MNEGLFSPSRLLRGMKQVYETSFYTNMYRVTHASMYLRARSEHSSPCISRWYMLELSKRPCPHARHGSYQYRTSFRERNTRVGNGPHGDSGVCKHHGAVSAPVFLTGSRLGLCAITCVVCRQFGRFTIRKTSPQLWREFVLAVPSLHVCLSDFTAAVTLA